MEVLICPLCGGILESKHNGTYICTSCGTEQLPKSKPEQIGEQKLYHKMSWQMVVAAMSEKQYEKAITLIAQMLDENNDGTIKHLMEKKDGIMNCCLSGVDQAANQLVDQMTVASKDSYFGLLRSAIGILETIDIDEKNIFLSMSVRALNEKLAEEINTYKGIKLSEYGFEKLRLTALMIESIIISLRKYDVDRSDIGGFFQTAIEAFQILKNNNSSELVRDKWGAYRYVPRFDCEEMDSLNNKIIHFLNKKREVLQ